MMLSFAFISSPSAQTVNQEKLKLVSTISLLHDVVNQVGGDKIDSDFIIPVGVDPHDYIPTLQDTQLLANADFVFFIGVVEESLLFALNPLVNEGKAISVLDTIPEESKIYENNIDLDPHFWHDPKLMEFVVDEIAIVLSSLEANGVNNSDFYSSNAAAYKSQLNMLDIKIKADLEALTHSQKILALEHDAFSYFGNAYDFEILSLLGISTNDEAGLAEINDLAAELKNKAVEVIFLETSSVTSEIKAVIDATSALGWKVEIGGVLFASSIENGEVNSYLGLIEANVKTIIGSILYTESRSSVAYFGFTSIISGFLLFILVINAYRKEIIN